MTEWNPRKWDTIRDTFAPRNNCFRNAGHLAEQEGFRYVEGIAHLLPGFPPVHHSWCVTDADEVVEVTWPWPGYGYLGMVVVPTTVGEPVFDPSDFQV